MKYRYVGECAKGYVAFKLPGGDTIVMKQGQAVEVPEFLANKFAGNNHFESVDAPAKSAAPAAAKKRKEKAAA